MDGKTLYSYEETHPNQYPIIDNSNHQAVLPPPGGYNVNQYHAPPQPNDYPTLADPSQPVAEYDKNLNTVASAQPDPNNIAPAYSQQQNYQTKQQQQGQNLPLHKRIDKEEYMNDVAKFYSAQPDGDFHQPSKISKLIEQLDVAFPLT